MEIVGKLSNNKIFCYKYFYENLESNFDNFLKVINTNDRTAISDYIDLLYKKMVDTDESQKLNRKEPFATLSEVVEKDGYKVIIVYVKNTIHAYDVSNIGIVIDKETNEFNYFIRLNKAVFVLGEFGNAYHIKKDYAKLAGYIDIISDDNLAKEFIDFTKKSNSEDVSFKDTAKEFIDKNLNLEKIKNVSKRNIESLKKFKEENFPKKKTREEVEAELNSIDSINETMNKMMNSMSKDFDLDLQNVNMDFSNNINKELGELQNEMNKLRSVRYYDDPSNNPSKINYINKISYGDADLNKMKAEGKASYVSKEDLVLTEEEKIVSKIIYNNKWIKEYNDSYLVFDMCDTSHDLEYGIFNTLLLNRLEGFDNNELDKKAEIVNCRKCKLDKCPINAYLKVMSAYRNSEYEFLGTEFYKSKENTKEELKVVLDKLKKFDKLSLYTAEFILKSYLLKDMQKKNDNIYEIEYVDIEKLGLDTQKLSLLKNLIDVSLNDEKILDYMKKEEIDISKLENFEVNAYSDVVTENPYHLAAYIKYLAEKENVILFNIFEELRETKYVNAAKKDLKVRNFERRVNALFIDEKSKNEIKNMISYAKKYSEFDSLEYIPFNLRLYTDNSELIEKVSYLLKDVFNYYGYIRKEKVGFMSFYDVDSPTKISDIYSDTELGILVLKDVFSIESIDKNLKERIVNKLYEVTTNNREVMITIVVDTDRLRIDSAFSSNPVLRDKIFDFELKEEKISEQEIYVKLLARLEKNFKLTDDFRVELLEYINSTFNKSSVSFKEYSDGLYERIIFNSNKDRIEAKDIPEYDKNKSTEEIFEELNELVGLENVKEALVDLANLIEFKTKTEGELKLKSTNLHMVFLGNPGTGKTTVARMIAGILYNLKYIKYNKFVEVSSKDLVAKYVGQTAPKTMEVVEKAMGGVLFIDEAYSLATGDGGEGSFNDECIATLIQAMENYRDNLVVIFAGYKKEMQDFLDSNSGIVSRIGYTLDFKDYTVDQLMLIFNQMIEKAGFKIEPQAIEKAKGIVLEYKDTDNFGNARFVRTLYEKVLIKHAKNMKDENDLEKLRTISEDDITAENIMKM